MVAILLLSWLEARGGVLPILRYIRMLRKCPFFAIFLSLSEEKCLIFSLCAPFISDNSHFH